MTILELAERCEAATGPDRTLDEEILAAIYPELAGTLRMAAPPHRFTASVDAALTLVPEGWNRAISSIAGKPPSVRLWNDESDIAVWRANTEALAICAAALRARVQ